MEQVIIMHPNDNIAIVLAPFLSEKSEFTVNGKTICARKEIPFAHKVAIADISKGGQVFKYGEPVGIAIEDIVQGDHVHVHNVISGRHTVK